MNKKLLIPVLAIVWFVIPALVAHVMFGQSPVAHQIRGNGTVHELYASTGAGSIGREREQAVLAATGRYVASHPDAPEAVKRGRALAPVDALNADLAAHRARFRVKAVSGGKAQFYEVS